MLPSRRRKVAAGAEHLPMDENPTPKVAPEWVHETFGATALELGLYEEASEEDRAGAPQGPSRPAWMEME